jgi:excisionase family DNA binding protein
MRTSGTHASKVGQRHGSDRPGRQDRGKTATDELFLLGDDLPIVLSVPRAARLLGISKDLAYELVAADKLPAIHLGRRIVVPTRRLIEFIEGKDTWDKADPGSQSA